MGKGLNNWPFRHFWCPPFHLLGGLQDVVGLQQIDPFLHRDQVLHRRHDLAEPRVAVGDDDSVTGNTAKIRDGLLSKKYLKSWVWYFLMCLCVFFGWLLNTVDMFCYFWWGWMAEHIQNRVLNQKKKLGVPTTTSHNACVVRPSIGKPINRINHLGPKINGRQRSKGRCHVWSPVPRAADPSYHLRWPGNLWSPACSSILPTPGTRSQQYIWTRGNLGWQLKWWCFWWFVHISIQLVPHEAESSLQAGQDVN